MSVSQEDVSILAATKLGRLRADRDRADEARCAAEAQTELLAKAHAEQLGRQIADVKNRLGQAEEALGDARTREARASIELRKASDAVTVATSNRNAVQSQLRIVSGELTKLHEQHPLVFGESTEAAKS